MEPTQNKIQSFIKDLIRQKQIYDSWFNSEPQQPLLKENQKDYFELYQMCKLIQTSLQYLQSKEIFKHNTLKNQLQILNNTHQENKKIIELLENKLHNTPKSTTLFNTLINIDDSSQDYEKIQFKNQLLKIHQQINHLAKLLHCDEYSQDIHSNSNNSGRQLQSQKEQPKQSQKEEPKQSQKEQPKQSQKEESKQSQKEESKQSPEEQMFEKIKNAHIIRTDVNDKMNMGNPCWLNSIITLLFWIEPLKQHINDKNIYMKNYIVNQLHLFLVEYQKPRSIEKSYVQNYMKSYKIMFDGILRHIKAEQGEKNVQIKIDERTDQDVSEVLKYLNQGQNKIFPNYVTIVPVEKEEFDYQVKIQEISNEKPRKTENQDNIIFIENSKCQSDGYAYQHGIQKGSDSPLNIDLGKRKLLSDTRKLPQKIGNYKLKGAIINQASYDENKISNQPNPIASHYACIIEYNDDYYLVNDMEPITLESQTIHHLNDYYMESGYNQFEIPIWKKHILNREELDRKKLDKEYDNKINQFLKDIKDKKVFEGIKDIKDMKLEKIPKDGDKSVQIKIPTIEHEIGVDNKKVKILADNQWFVKWLIYQYEK